ncbi:MAG: carboxypeptidase-like regulatory domain-containing protein [Bacteroides sp.]|jgi:hypothetical protein|nr:carboxypeptidase-like regulatory domain-containing protein [Bacteroides sp.]MCI1683814.1 carboxypeptidase-like regulatory domain-containing protein [Bacteroides sp.]
MKKNVFTVLLASLLIISFQLIFSCKSDLTNDNPIHDTTVTNPFSYVGTLHNEGLDYVFNYIKKEKENTSTRNNIQTLNMAELCQTATESYANQKGLKCAPSAIITRSTSSSNKTDSLNLSKLGIKYCNILMEIISKKANNENLFTKAIQSLNEDILSDKNLNKKERDALLCGTATAEASFHYWQTNLNSWNSTINVTSYKNNTRNAPSSVEGQVTDANNEPIIGASVVIVNPSRGSLIGTLTNINGIYQISNINLPVRLRFSMVGFVTIETTANYQIVNVIMKEDVVDDGIDWTKIIGSDAIGAISGGIWKGIPGAIASGIASSATAAL